MNTIIRQLSLPILFIFLYGSGFVFTAFGLENSSPMAFLALRFFIAFFILLLIAYIFKVSWPESLKEFFHVSFAGMLTVGVFSIGVFLSLDFGISASLSALIIALQPILVTFLASYFLGEKLNKRIIIGLVIGIIGVTFVVSSKTSNNDTQLLGVVFSIIALLGLSFGNIYQKKYCSQMNLFSGGAIQTLASTILALPLLLFYEDIYLNINREFIIALLYMSVAVSIGALSILYIMIRNGDVSKVSSMFYLVPISAAVVGYFVLKNSFDINIIIGVVFVLVSIILINRK
ncbi:DMT family transporter [Arcobacter sp. YIC-310]|uniref:DMT family transporter n=1 Tax=Arcobacter sp. YIC-310 TaxID=3376632 RepID=UPI003C2783CD